jgi:PAS domain S-box-containing protein
MPIGNRPRCGPAITGQAIGGTHTTQAKDGYMNLQIKHEAIRDINSSFSTQQQWIDGQLSEVYAPPMLSLDDRGIIRECNKSVEKLSGYQRNELVWQHISCLIPQFAEIDLVLQDEVNPLLTYICHCDHVFEAIDKHGEIITCNLNLFTIRQDGTTTLRLILRPVDAA